MSEDEPDEGTTAELMTKFDSVQIFVTRADGHDTLDFSYGLGNWFSRYGQVDWWFKNRCIDPDPETEV